MINIFSIHEYLVELASHWPGFGYMFHVYDFVSPKASAKFESSVANVEAGGCIAWSVSRHPANRKYFT